MHSFINKTRKQTISVQISEHFIEKSLKLFKYSNSEWIRNSNSTVREHSLTLLLYLSNKVIESHKPLRNSDNDSKQISIFKIQNPKRNPLNGCESCLRSESRDRINFQSHSLKMIRIILNRELWLITMFNIKDWWKKLTKKTIFFLLPVLCVCAEWMHSSDV